MNGNSWNDLGKSILSNMKVKIETKSRFYTVQWQMSIEETSLMKIVYIKWDLYSYGN